VQVNPRAKVRWKPYSLESTSIVYSFILRELARQRVLQIFFGFSKVLILVCLNHIWGEISVCRKGKCC
jgi:hypothetical protein